MWVSSRLQGGNLKQLVAALEQFLEFYEKIRQGTSQIEIEGGGYVSRLKGLVEDLNS